MSKMPPASRELAPGGQTQSACSQPYQRMMPRVYQQRREKPVCEGARLTITGSVWDPLNHISKVRMLQPVAGGCCDDAVSSPTGKVLVCSLVLGKS